MTQTGPRLCFVDVGTHAAQEYLALLGHGRAGYLRHYLRHRRRTRRKGATPMTWAAFRAFLADTDALRAHRARISYVMVEPNARLFALPVYRHAEHAFNIALSADPATASILPCIPLCVLAARSLMKSAFIVPLSPICNSLTRPSPTVTSCIRLNWSAL